MNWKAYRLRARIKLDKLLVHMILRAKKRLQSRLKRDKSHVMLMLASMNVANTYHIQHMNTREHHNRRTSVR